MSKQTAPASFCAFCGVPFVDAQGLHRPSWSAPDGQRYCTPAHARLAERQPELSPLLSVLGMPLDEQRFRAACAAMQGMLASKRYGAWGKGDRERIVDESVDFADRLLARLRETEGGQP